MNGSLVYEDKWFFTGIQKGALLHIALPPYFLATFPSFEMCPCYIVPHHNRICLGWIFHEADPIQVKFELIYKRADFERAAMEFIGVAQANAERKFSEVQKKFSAEKLNFPIITDATKKKHDVIAIGGLIFAILSVVVAILTLPQAQHYLCQYISIPCH